MTGQDYGVVLGTIGFVTAAYGITVKLLWSKFNGVQYKDNCSQIVKRIEQRADDRHFELTRSLDRIEKLIKNGGTS